MKAKIIRVFTLLLVFGAFLSYPVRAQNSETGNFSISVSPLPINLVTTPGSSISTDLRIQNTGTQVEVFQVGLMKFGAYGETGQPQLMDRQPGDEYFDWVTFSADKFEVSPNEWKTITMTVNVPPTAAFGYYYAVTFSRANEETEIGPRQTTLTGATASLVLLEVRVPNAKRQVEVVEFSADRQIYEFLPTTFTIKIANQGNVHLAPRGNIFISQGDNKKVALLEVNQARGNILPDSSRVFSSEWTEGFPVNLQKIEDNKVVLDAAGNQVRSLSWDFSKLDKLRFGKYTADLLLVYDDGIRDQTVEGQLSFWVIPWRLIGFAGLFILLAFMGIRSIIKDTWKKFSSPKSVDPS